MSTYGYSRAVSTDGHTTMRPTAGDTGIEHEIIEVIPEPQEAPVFVPEEAPTKVPEKTPAGV